MQRSSICSPLEEKEMRRGFVERNSWTVWQSVLHIESIWRWEWKVNSLKVCCICNGSSHPMQTSHIGSTDQFVLIQHRLQLLIPLELVYSSILLHFLLVPPLTFHHLILCSQLLSSLWLPWWPNGLVISASWLQTAVICLSGALQGRNVQIPPFSSLAPFSKPPFGFFLISPVVFLCCLRETSRKLRLSYTWVGRLSAKSWVTQNSRNAQVLEQFMRNSKIK